MGAVAEHLRAQLSKLVDDNGIVVWFDRERHYQAFAAGLSLPNAVVLRYVDSFFALRHEADPLLEGETVPRLLVYVPLAEEDTADALIELTAAGCVAKPRGTATRNTRLAIVARAALHARLSEEQLRALEKQIDSAKLTSLEEVERAIERVRRSADPSVLALVFGTTEPDDIALAFLAAERDEQITAKQAQADLTALLADTYSADARATSLTELRDNFARRLLCTDLLTTLHEPLPPQLASVTIAPDGITQSACQRLARRWRQDRDRADAYVAHATRVERELALGSVAFTLDGIGECDTFAAVERAAESAIEAAWLEHPSADLLPQMHARRRTFWVQRDLEMQARWALIDFASQLLLRAQEIEAAFKQSPQSATVLLNRYVRGADGTPPWCELDTAHRELEQHSRRFDYTAQHEILERLVATVRRRYGAVGDALADRFVHALQASGFKLDGVPRQRDIFATHVAPALERGKTAYVLADALRYEMAQTLFAGLRDSFDIQLSAAVASVPTITEIGMASLMPEVADGEVVEAGGGKLALRVGETLLRSRETRMAWLRDHVTDAHPYFTTLDDLLAPKTSVKSGIAAAQLVVVTSQEIDEVAEMDNIALARALMDPLLSHLARGIRRLAELGCQRIVLVADHGFLFGDELDAAMKIDSPGGHTADLHRRVWVGRGGATNAAYLRTRLSDFGPCESELEIAVPWGFGAFKAPGGARAYFHGGLSLPELVIPVATLIPIGAANAAQATGDIEWTLTSGSRRITTRSCSVTISGRRTGLFEVTVPPVRVEIRSGKDGVAVPRFATYGLSEATQEVQLRYTELGAVELEPCTLSMEIDPEKVHTSTVTIHLLDARTAREVATTEPVDYRITIA